MISNILEGAAIHVYVGLYAVMHTYLDVFVGMYAALRLVQ